MTLQPAEKKFLAWLIVAVVLLTSAPYVMGWIATPPGKSYTGIHRLTTGDIAVYYSFIEQGREGNVVSKNLYSSEPQPVAAVLTPQWFLLGQLANLFHLPTVLAYQLSRVGFAVLFLILAYRFLAGLLAPPRQRMVAMVVIAFASGFGDLIPLGNLKDAISHLAIPVDIWVPEAFPFTSLYHNPLFLMGLCGILGVLLLVERAMERHDETAAWVASGLALVLAIIHPYDVFVLAAILVATLLVRVLADHQWTPARARAYLRTLLIVLGPSVVALGIQRVTFALQPALAGWGSQNVTLSPAVWWYLPAYLVPCILAAFGVRHALRQQSSRWFTVLAWAGVIPLLLYLPHFPYQRRMMEGWFIALVALASLGVLGMWARLHPRLGELGRSAVIGLVIPLAFILGGMTSLGQIVKDAYYVSYGTTPTYVPSGVMQGFTWLRDHTAADARVLAQPFDSNLLPGWAGRTVYYGHSDLTANRGEKLQNVDAFFTRRQTFDANAFIQREHLNYLLIRTTDVSGLASVQARHVASELVYQNADVLVYRLLASATVTAR